MFSNIKDVYNVLEVEVFDDEDNIQDDFPCDLFGKVRHGNKQILILILHLVTNPTTEYWEWKGEMVPIKG